MHVVEGSVADRTGDIESRPGFALAFVEAQRCRDEVVLVAVVADWGCA